MAYDYPMPDIERARQIIDALGAMVVGEPCPSCAGEDGRTRPAPSGGTRRFVDCSLCRGFGVVGGPTQQQGEAIAALFAGDHDLFELLDERPGHWRSLALAPSATPTPAGDSGTGSCARRATRACASSSAWNKTRAARAPRRRPDL